jgi:hypothetical protein
MGHRPITAKSISLGTRLVSHSESDRDQRLLRKKVRNIARMPSPQRMEAIQYLVRRMGADLPPEVTSLYIERLLRKYR